MEDQRWVVVEGSEANQSAFAISVTKITIDRILKLDKHRADALALYLFYAYTARWKHSNEIWANNQYAATSLSWGVDKVRRVRQVLIGLKLIETIYSRGDRGRLSRPLVRVNYLAQPKVADQSLNLPVVVDSGPNEEELVKRKKKNLLATAQAIYDEYPRKVAKPKAIIAIIAALKKTAADPDMLLERTRAFARVWSTRPTERWRFIPHPATWFNQERYNDDEKEWLLVATEPPQKKASPFFQTQKQITACTDEINRLWRDNKFFVKGSNGQRLDVPPEIRAEITTLRKRRDDLKKQLTK